MSQHRDELDSQSTQTKVSRLNTGNLGDKNGNNKKTKKKSRWRWLTRLLWLLLILILMILGVAYWLVYTNSGTRTALSVARDFFPPGLQIEQVDGVLAGPLQVGALQYQDDSLTISGKQMQLDWRPMSLLESLAVGGYLEIDQVLAEELIIDVGASEDEPTEEGLPEISLPIDIRVNALSLQKLVVNTPDTQQTLENITLEAAFQEQTLSIASLSLGYWLPMDGNQAVVTTPTVTTSTAATAMPIVLTATLAGDITLSGDYPLDMQLDWQLPPTSELPRYTGALQLDGNVAEALHGQLVLAEPQPANITYRIEQLLTELQWQVDAAIPQVPLNTWMADLPEFSAGLTIEAAGDDQQATVENLLVNTLEGQVSGDGQVSWSNLLNWQADLVGNNINLKDFLPELVGELNWQLTTKGQLNQQGQPELTARLTSFNGHLVGFEGQVPKFSGSAVLALEQQVLTIQSLLLDTLEGTVKADGKLFLPDVNATGVAAETLRWQANVTAKNINIQRYQPELAGKLSTDLYTAGAVQGDDIDVTAEIKSLQGDWRQQKITGSGKLRYADNWLDINQLLVKASGGQADTSKVQANGRLHLQAPYEGRIDFAADVNALNQWLPDARGNVLAKGSLQGTARELRLQAKVQAKEFEYTNNDIETIDADINVDLHGQGQSTVAIKLNNAALGGTEIKQAELALNGNAAQHTIILDSVLPEAKVKLALQGAAIIAQSSRSSADQSVTGNDSPLPKLLAIQGWQGEINTLDFDTNTLAKWQLQQPMNVVFRQNRLEASSSCIVSQAGRTKAGDTQSGVVNVGAVNSDAGLSKLCFGGEWTEQDGVNVAGDITAVPLRLVEPFLPPEYKLSGELDGEFKFVTNPAGVVDGQLNLGSPTGGISTRLTSNHKAEFTYTDLALTGVVQGDELRIQGQAELADNSATENAAFAKIDIGIGLQPPLPLSGSIKANIDRLTGVSIFVPQLTDVRGNAEIDIALSGTANDPKFAGKIEIDASRADVVPLGARIEDLYVIVKADGSGTFSLLGEFLAGGGALDFNGEVSIPSTSTIDGWVGEIKVQGEKVELLKTPDMRGRFSPKLVLGIKGQQLTLNGDLTLYDTELKLKRFASIIPESDDVVIIGEIPTEEESEPLLLEGAVNIIMGDPLVVTGEGLEAEVSGELRLGLRPNDLPLGRGQLTVKGNFSAYGQDLNFENSQLIFSDVVVSNPGLSVTAVRTIESPKQVRVGLQITGSANNPKIEIFSVPTMTQSEALAYLVLGRPLDDSTNNPDDDSLDNAAAALGAAGGNVLGKWVGNRVGIDSLGFEAGRGGQVDFVLGTQLGERLFVNFRQGLFDPVTALQLQYILNDRCNLEAQTSTDGQGVDLRCSFERD